jgi:hypothetical protein
MLWVGIPVGWLYVGSQLQPSQDPNMGIYMLVFAGIVASMIITGRFLSRLNRAYAHVTNTDAHVRVHLPWMRSLRGGASEGHERSVLDVVMVISVGLAAVAMGVWFLFFAGSPFQ